MCPVVSQRRERKQLLPIIHNVHRACSSVNGCNLQSLVQAIAADKSYKRCLKKKGCKIPLQFKKKMTRLVLPFLPQLSLMYLSTPVSVWSKAAQEPNVFTTANTPSPSGYARRNSQAVSVYGAAE